MSQNTPVVSEVRFEMEGFPQGYPEWVLTPVVKQLVAQKLLRRQKHGVHVWYENAKGVGTDRLQFEVRQRTNKIGEERLKAHGLEFRYYLGNVQPKKAPHDESDGPGHWLCQFCGNQHEFVGRDNHMSASQTVYAPQEPDEIAGTDSYDSEIGEYDEIECAVCRHVIWREPEVHGVAMLTGDHEIEMLIDEDWPRIFVGDTVEDACAQGLAQLREITDGTEPPEEMARIAALPTKREQFKALAEALGEGYVIKEVERREQ